ncbi:hypothetical protein HDV03_004120 [Kappamyces sp. JEL0829]|nr:hypothetical protein HDV03_004120 [Kappamyces sp. JEL0829]
MFLLWRAGRYLAQDRARLFSSGKPIELFPPLVAGLARPAVAVRPSRASPVQDWTSDLAPGRGSSNQTDLLPGTEKLVQDLNLRRDVSHQQILAWLALTPPQISHLTPLQAWTCYSRLRAADATSLLRMDDWRQLLGRLAWLDHHDETSTARVATLFKHLKQNSYHPDAFLWSCLMATHPYQCLKIHESMLQAWQEYAGIQKSKTKTRHHSRLPPISNKSIRTLLWILNRKTANWKKKEEDWRILWRDLTETGIDFTQDTLMGWLEGFSSVNDREMIEKIHDLLVKQKKRQPWNEGVYSGLMAAHSGLGNNRAVKRLFEEYAEQYHLGLLGPIEHYLLALLNTGAHREIEIYSKKILRLDLVLNRNCYVSILRSFAQQGDLESLRKWGRVVTKQVQTHPSMLPYSVLYDVLDAFAMVDSLEDCQRVFGHLETIRAEQVVLQNKAMELDYTTREMAGIFEDAYRTSARDSSILDRYREWKPTICSRRLLASLAQVLGRRKDPALVLDFFSSHVLDADGLYLYWAKKIAGQHKKLLDLQELSQTQLDEWKDARPSTAQPTSRQDLKETLSWTKRRLKRGLVLEVGEKGPLAVVYEAMISSWRSSNVMIDDPLELDNLLIRLTALEKKRVLELPLGDVFAVRKDAGQDGK